MPIACDPTEAHPSLNHPSGFCLPPVFALPLRSQVPCPKRPADHPSLPFPTNRERPPRQLLRPRHHSSHSPESTTDEEGDAPDSYDLEGSESLADPTEEEDWVHPRGEIEPDDSASGSVPSSSTFDQPGARPRPGQRSSTRQHSIPPRRPPRIHPHAAQAPPFVPQPGSEYLSPMTSEGTPDYPDLHGHYPPPGAPYPYDRRPTYQPSGVSGFAPPPHRSPYGNQMVSWATGGNPFMRNGYYEPGHEMMTYSQPGYFGGVAPSSYGMPYPQHAMVFQPKPPPPPTVVGGDPPASPAEKQPDPQLEEMRKQLEMLQLERTKADEAKRQADLEKRIREDAERQFKDRMEAMKEAQEQAKKDIEVARIAAEAAALERLEEARKAEEERRRLEAELKAQAARDERERIENERKEQEKRDKEHALALEKAEREAREKYEAAKAAEEERKLELERQRLLIETQTKEKILADQKAAEEARIAAEAKAAEDKARKELAEKEARQKAIEEYEAKMAEEKKAAEAAAQAEAAAKLRFADEKRLADEKAAADAEQKKKDDEEMKRRILADAKAEEEKKAAEAAAAAPPPEGEKEPIKFKDAVGRKYSFPFKLASKWEVRIPDQPSDSLSPPRSHLS